MWLTLQGHGACDSWHQAHKVHRAGLLHAVGKSHGDIHCVSSLLQVRVTAGTKPELVVLMDIPNVKAHRARLLYAAGLRTAESVAGSSEATLMSILAKGKLYTSATATA